jgi:hypothetical protein
MIRASVCMLSLHTCRIDLTWHIEATNEPPVSALEADNTPCGVVRSVVRILSH